MDKHTPGPWMLDDYGVYISPANQPNFSIAMVRGWGYLTGSLGLSGKEAEAIQLANGNLLAAAPELLAALERLEHSYRLLLEQKPVRDASETLAEVAQALAHAKGES